MIRNKRFLITIFMFFTACLFILTSCSNLPLIGKKEPKTDKLPEGKTVTIEGMESIKGANPPKPETPSSKKLPVQPPPKKEPETKVASVPTQPFYSPSLLLIRV